MSKETYQLSWTPSTSPVAATQNVVAILAGNTAAPVAVATDLANTVATVNFDFDTDVQVEWFVTVFNADKSKSLDSSHATFQATDQSALTPATNLSATWVSHTA